MIENLVTHNEAISSSISVPELLGELHVESLVVPDPDGLVLAAGHN